MFDINANIPLWLSLAFIVGGLVLLSWSADRFVGASASLARSLGMSPLIVGMVIIGFGTSAPELAVSVLSGLEHKADLSLGNAYGSCIFNLAMILGVAAMIWPIKVKPSVTFFAVPMLLGVTGLSFLLVRDGGFQLMDGVILLAAFAVVMPFYCWYDQMRGKKAEPADQISEEQKPERPKFKAMDIVWLLVGLTLLVASSHVLVWGCVDFARDVLGVTPLLIGLTIVAAGTSLPELASAIASARRKEHEFVIGNIVGSNLFNTLAVVGLAGTISPFSDFSPYVVTRDLPMIAAMSMLLGLFGVNWIQPSRPGRIHRWEGVVWALLFLAYLGVMIAQDTGHWKF